MQHNLNLVGQKIAEFRHQRRQTHEELAAKLQLLGCKITSQILAKIETGRSIVTDAQIVFFLEVFNIAVEDLFPLKSQSGNRTVLLAKKCMTPALCKGCFEKNAEPWCSRKSSV